jgi:hypothetical protein
VPSGPVTVMFVQATDWVAVSVTVETERTVEPSAGDSETSAGAGAATSPRRPAERRGVRFAAANVNGATRLPAMSWSAFSAATE